MKQKRSFIKLVQLLGVVLLVGIGSSIMILNIIDSSRDFSSRAEQMRTDYIARQKQLIKQEVNRAVAMISHEQNRSLSLAKNTVKSRVYEACAIAHSIYKRYKGTKSEAEIQEIIIEVLRPLRFDGGNGYIFIRRIDGVSMLHPIYPKMEGRHLNDIKNPEKREAAKKNLTLAISSGEGFSEYKWDKPLEKKETKKKITFVKLFPTYSWEIGSGIYIEDIEKPLKAEILQKISKIRFGKEGYIFINRFNGDALVSNGELMNGTKKLWEAFDNNPEKVKELFAQEYAAALKPKGDYIYYSWIKLTDPSKESPKTSFIHGIPELLWLVGAGVYLDDVESDIALMQSTLNGQIKMKLLYSILIIIGIVTLFLFFFNRLNRRLKNDFNLFASFFDRAASHNEIINRDLVKLVEFDRMAENANQMQEKIRQSEANLRQVFAAAKDVSFVKTDANGKESKIIDFSPGAEQIFGYQAEEIIGQPVALLHLREDVDKFPQIQEQMRTKREGFRGESILVRKSGETFPALFSSYPIFADDGEITSAIGVAIDITEQKRAEEELQKMEKLKSIGTLAGGIAHDFNNILMGLFGNISIAKEYLDKNHPAFYALEEAGKSMNRATSLTKQLLTFAKGGAPIREDVSLGELVSEVVRFDLSGSNVKLVFKQAPNLWLADVDKGQIQQVFSNLAINANQAMPAGGHLYITLENTEFSEEVLPGLQEGRYIKITVRDEGCGIDKKHLERIFDPYFSTKQTGSGLGLATTYSIVNRHGGHINVNSELGKGSIFTLLLPASEAKTIEKIEKTSNRDTSPTQKIKILVMDDEEIIREVVLQMLLKSGYEVETVDDGHQALEKYKRALDAEEPFDIIIMDLTIPGGMGGQETMKEILALDPDARAIVSSGYADDPVMANYSEYGFRGISTKPYSLNQLLEVLRLVMEQ